MSSQSPARPARRSTTSRTFTSVSGSARARATSTHSNCSRLEVLPALPRHPRRRPHPFRSPRPRRRWLRALRLRRLRPLPLHLPPSPLPHPSHSTAATAPGPVAAPRASSGGLLIGSSEPIKAASEHGQQSATRQAGEPPTQREPQLRSSDRSRSGRAMVEKAVAVEAGAWRARSTLVPGGDGRKGTPTAADPLRSERVARSIPEPRRRRARRPWCGRSEPTPAGRAARHHPSRRHGPVCPGGQKATPYHWHP